MLFGRTAERARIAELLDGVRDGRSGVLVLRGEAGIGKSALLDSTRDQASGLTVLSACGIESEARLAYAGLHQLLRPVLSELGNLPDPQARALRSALGLEAGRNDEWFLVSLAVLTLLSEVAEDRPVLCLVDDAQWLDDASAESLLFAARRLEAEKVGLLFAARDGEARTFDAPGLPELRLQGLDHAAAHGLLDRQAGLALSADERERLIEGTGGNPLALQELSSTLTDSQLEGLAPLPVSSRIERSFRARVELLPDDTQTLLLLAAADDSRSAATVLAAAARLGVEGDALDAAEQAGLVRVRDSQVEFRHPLIRSAVYQAAPFSRRRAAHQALADVFVRAADADRRAWHRAAACVELDASVAGELEQAAWRAYRRSGFVAASLAFERAAELTADTRQSARLLGHAVDGAWFAGRLPRALALLERARPLADDPGDRAEIDRWRGLIEMSIGVPTDARDLLISAARHLPPRPRGRALHLVGLACVASAYGGEGERVPAIARSAEALSDHSTPLTGFLTCFARGTGAYFAHDYQSAATLFRRALELAAEAQAAASTQVPGWLLLAGASALFLGDDAAAERANRHLVSQAREAGALPLVNEVLPRLMLSQVALGRWSAAAADLAEGARLATEIGQHQVVGHVLSMSALVAGLRGDDAECRRLADDAAQLASARRLMHVASTARWALLALELGSGRPDEAFLHAREISQLPIAHWSAPERVEAAARAGHEQTARAWLGDFAAWAAATGEDWAQAAVLRCQGLLSEDPAEKLKLYEQALDRAQAGSRPLERARAELALGECLRRTGRRVEARLHLRAALDGFASLGAALWAERAREELRASGQTVRRREPEGRTALTQQELQIARFVAQGLSNREVAAQLFLSPRTIDFHLRKVFNKLGISSRMQLVHHDLEVADRGAGAAARTGAPVES